MTKKYQPRFLRITDQGEAAMPLASARVHEWIDTRTKKTIYGVEVRLKGKKTWCHAAELHVPTGRLRVIISHKEAVAIKLVEKIKANIKAEKKAVAGE